ncbi:hypothetical protein H7992_09330 [Sporosarcina sp. resist]|uniref:hypothetical protein n=1 Tax=Sporosarcina sp. resist TaxID=2762563 RepID=UPI00164D5E6A|nr:hypothetical protein [Sporosarcina sp. resist]QNK89827.1 hypothetical protein H7992_09330 [Sporosarcina sp. resist]
MVGKQLERLVSNNKKGSANKSFICFMDDKRERKFLVFKFGGIYQLDGNGEVKKMDSLTDIQDIFMSIENGDVKIIGSGDIGI